MTTNPTQRQVVINKLRQEGKISNFWAFHNYILRLGDIIFRLRSEGWEIKGEYGEGGERKNFIYTLVSEPEPKKLTLF